MPQLLRSVPHPRQRARAVAIAATLATILLVVLAAPAVASRPHRAGVAGRRTGCPTTARRRSTSRGHAAASSRCRHKRPGARGGRPRGRSLVPRPALEATPLGSEAEGPTPSGLSEEQAGPARGEGARLHRGRGGSPGSGSGGGASESGASGSGSSGAPEGGSSGPSNGEATAGEGPETPCVVPAETTGESPVCARAETFGGQPADVLLTYASPATTTAASGCVGVLASGVHEPFGGVEQGPTPQTIRLPLLPGGAMPAQVQCPAPAGEAAAAAAAAVGLTVTRAAPSEGGVVSDPIDSRYLTDVPFGETSFWIQPWRAYLDTWPASHLLDAVGINFNVPPTEAEPVAQLLQDNGFKLARISIPWDALSYSDPTSISKEHEDGIRTRLVALQRHDLRPLFVLEANSEAPGPLKVLTLTTTAEAPAGATTVQLDPTSAAEVVPGKTGFNYLSWRGAPDILITAITPAGRATLSRPLPNALAAGPHGATTLLYSPFAPPKLADGEPNPQFRATLEGWLSYVATVSRVAQEAFGAGGYDLEVWNELSFGSQFLNLEDYGPPLGKDNPAARHKAEVTHSIVHAVLAETVAFVRNPANGISPEVGISDGFASESPFPSGAAAPLGETALSKHPYVGRRIYPGSYRVDYDRPVNALGEIDLANKPVPPFTPLFIPSYEALLPEYTLTALSTETLVRDIAPFTTKVYGFPHGREVGPPGGAPVQKWITEYNLSIPEGTTGLSFADRTHFHAKALLRSLVAMVGKGIDREYFFAAGSGPFSLISSAFYEELEAHPGTYPGDRAGGEILGGIHNLITHIEGPGPEGPARQLKLLSIVQSGNHAQFLGDGTAAHPTLYDRDVLAVLPFQSAPERFVVPVYVMTSDLLTLYEPEAPATDIHRFDLPQERFRITLGNLPESASPPSVGAYDPLLEQQTPARLISRRGSTAVFEIAATDYPRLLSIDYGAAD